MPKTDAISVIEAALAPLSGKHVLDVGCGGGALARSLSDRGARVVGLDPNGEALAVARQAVPTGTFYQAVAEAMTFADDSFDGAIFLNSLHHVPKLAMRQALREAARVTKPAGPIVIIEPLAAGSFFSVLRTVEDETTVRAAAQEIIAEALESGTFEQLSLSDYPRRERFADLDEFLARVVAAEPERAATVGERRPEVEAAFRRHGRISEDGGIVLEQPIRAHVLTKKG